MKKIAYFLSIMFLFTAIAPTAIAKDNKKGKEQVELTAEEQARLREIESRVKEIRALDFTEMTKEERRGIKSELKAMNKEAKALGGGIYLSVGAIIIILLILILLT